MSSVDTSTAGGFDDVAGGGPMAMLFPQPATSAAEIPAITAIFDIAPNMDCSLHSILMASDLTTEHPGTSGHRRPVRWCRCFR